MPTPIVFEDVAPVVPVRDLQAALERYRQLGFEVRAYGHGTGYARNVLAIANGMTAEQGVSDRNPPSTRLPAMSWLIRDSLGVHYRFGLLAQRFPAPADRSLATRWRAKTCSCLPPKRRSR